MKNKKGQISKVFIYLSMMIVVATLLVTGFNAVGTVTEVGCETVARGFQESLIELFDSNRNPGSFQAAELNAPCDATLLCVGSIETESFFEDQRVVPGVVAASRAGVSQNIFLIQNREVLETYEYDNFLNIEGNTQQACIPTTGGSFALEVEGHTRGLVSVSAAR